MPTPRCRDTRPNPDSELSSRVAADADALIAIFPKRVDLASRVDKRPVAELHRALGYGRPRRRSC